MKNDLYNKILVLSVVIIFICIEIGYNPLYSINRIKYLFNKEDVLLSISDIYTYNDKEEERIDISDCSKKNNEYYCYLDLENPTWLNINYYLYNSYGKVVGTLNGNKINSSSSVVENSLFKDNYRIVSGSIKTDSDINYNNKLILTDGNKSQIVNIIYSN